MKECIATIRDLIAFNLSDVILILLSIIFPLLIIWEEKSRRKIDKFAFLIFNYLNKEELNKRDTYFQWLDSISSNGKGKIDFFTNIEIRDNNPLLLPDRSGDENNRIRNWQREIRKAARLLNVSSVGKYFIAIAVIIFLLFTK